MMRTTLSIVILQLTVMVGLSAMAIAQSEEASTQPTPVLHQEEESKQEVEPVRSGVSLLSSLRQRLDDVYSLAEKLKSEIEKIDVQQKDGASVPPTVSPVTIDPPKSPLELFDTATQSPPDAPAPPARPSTARAEVDGSESFETVAGDAIPSDASLGNYIDTMPIPVLNGSTPDWVKNGLVIGEDHNFAISSTLMPDLEQCREDLKSRMMSDVSVYLDKHVLQFSEATSLPELTQEYVEKYWVKKGQVFDNIQDRPSGTYHQLWIGLHISAEQLTKIREWEKQIVRDQRTKKVGVLGGIGVCAITLLSGAVGLLARREKAKLKG